MGKIEVVDQINVRLEKMSKFAMSLLIDNELGEKNNNKKYI